MFISEKLLHSRWQGFQSLRLSKNISQWKVKNQCLSFFSTSAATAPKDPFLKSPAKFWFQNSVSCPMHWKYRQCQNATQKTPKFSRLQRAIFKFYFHTHFLNHLCLWGVCTKLSLLTGEVFKPYWNSITAAGHSFALSHYLRLLKTQVGAVKFWQIWALGVSASQAASCHW